MDSYIKRLQFTAFAISRKNSKKNQEIYLLMFYNEYKIFEKGK